MGNEGEERGAIGIREAEEPVGCEGSELAPDLSRWNLFPPLS